MEGYRTLLVGMKVLDEVDVQKFQERCEEAEQDIKNRVKKLEAIYDKFERDLILLGGTVLEDKLQDKVAETIQALH